MKRRCQSLTKFNKPCRAAPTAGGLCYFHANPNKASELGRIGGRKRNGKPLQRLDPSPTLDSPKSLGDFLSQITMDTYEGRLDPRIAEALAPLLRLRAQILDTAVFDRALQELASTSHRKDLRGEHDPRTAVDAIRTTALPEAPASAEPEEERVL